MTKTILLNCEEQIAYLTFNRPEKGNAFNRKMMIDFENAIDKIRMMPLVRVVVMRGAGHVFMSSSDMEEFHVEFGSADALTAIRGFNASVLALREMDKFVLAVVEGSVEGYGMSLMLAADLVLSEESTQFYLDFSKMGLSPVGCVSFNLPRLVGSKKAAELLLLSQTFNAYVAKEYGLINWIMQKTEIDRYTNTILQELINRPRTALIQTKQLLNSSWQNKVTAQLELEAESFLKSIHSKDFEMALRSSVTPRYPEFEGQ